MKKSLLLALALLVALAPGAMAQTARGNVYGTVTDESGAALPGAAVSISGANIGGRSTTSGSQGDFRFLTLDPGTYKLAVSLTGFTTVNREIIVTTGVNVNLSFALKVATVEETVTVTAETPVVDAKKLGTATTLSKEELSQTPNSRDPWAVLRTVPGVMVDRVNIAGNESGQQASFVGKGSYTTDSMWNLDGVTITDAAATGASPTYFDYDAFEEISVTTGGSDVRVQTGGIGLNFVTKRGTNNFHGAVRGYFTDHKLQTSNTAGTTLATDARLKGSDKADHIDQIADYGADIGGPIVKDKLWFWVSYGKQDIRNVRTDQTKDKTVLKDYNGKINWQASDKDMVSLFYFSGEKIKEGRSPGWSGIASYQDGALFNQGGAYQDGRPHGLSKLEDNHVFSPNFFGNIKLSYYNSGFGFVPRGGLDKPAALDFVTATAIGSTYYYHTVRPQYNGNLDFNYFKPGWGGNHEFKFGFGYRQTPVTSTTGYPGDKTFAVKLDPTGGYAHVTRDSVRAYEYKYSFGYLSDTFTKDRWTFNVGVRFDQQKGGLSGSTAPGNPTFPNLLPSLTFAGGGQGVDFKDFAPRLGITYALNESRKTVLRASYARYAGQLGGGIGTYDSPLGASPSYLAFNWVDTNNDGFAQPSEIINPTVAGVAYYAFVDPANPTSVSSPNKIDANLKINHDQEVIAGIDHELFANFAIGTAFTWKKGTDISWTPRIGLTTADYTANAPVTRNGYTVQTYSPNTALVAATGGGRIETQRNGYYTQFMGVEVTATKRLSNKWFGRLAFSYNDWTEHFSDKTTAIQNPTRTDTNPGVDGGAVAPRSGGSGKGDIFYNAKWQLTAAALYQLPWDFDVSGQLYARQGYPRPIVISTSAGRDGTVRALATPNLDDTKYATLVDLDLRIAKTIKIAGSTAVVLTADCFNVLNANTVLNQVRTASSSAFNRIDELLAPRVFRFGARLTW